MSALVCKNTPSSAIRLKAAGIKGLSRLTFLRTKYHTVKAAYTKASHKTAYRFSVYTAEYGKRASPLTTKAIYRTRYASACAASAASGLIAKSIRHTAYPPTNNTDTAHRQSIFVIGIRSET